MDQNIRINKFLSNAGLCSRREADQYIKMGLVEVNGKIITELGFKVKASDEVKYDGTRIKTKPFLYILINKPKGFIATFQGDKIDKPVQDLISSKTNPGLIPVDDMGRPMTGLLILTNDGELRKRLNKSKSTKMVYKAVLNENHDSFFRNIKILSSLVLQNFDKMIPKPIFQLWEEGINTDNYYLKLCGSGGGGYFLGFTKDFKSVKKLLKDYPLEMVYKL